MIRRPPRSTLDRSSAASDVYKRQALDLQGPPDEEERTPRDEQCLLLEPLRRHDDIDPVSYTHLRAHETVLDLVCRLLLAKKNNALR